MTSHSTMREQPQSETEAAVPLFDNWFDPIEAGLRDRAREFLQAMLEGELDEVLERSRYARRAKRSAEDSEGAAGVTGHTATGRGRCWGHSAR
jgi:putative transposase